MAIHRVEPGRSQEPVWDLECVVDDERVTGHGGAFYDGWITRDVVSPLKGGAGSARW